MKKKIKISELIILLIFFAFIASCIMAKEYRAAGFIYRQNKDARGFTLLNDEALQYSLPYGIYATRNCSAMPLATDTFIAAGSSTMILFPGAMVKYDKFGFRPLTGRIQLVGTDLSDKFIIAARKFMLHLDRGNISIEVTPDNGTYIAVRGESEGIIKTFERKVIELANGMEVHFPLFAPEKISKRISSFWTKPPTAFSSVRLFDVDPQVASVDELASVSEEIDDSILPVETTASESYELSEN